MVRRLRQTLMDYMVIGISPALIMGMVGSLLFFLLTVFYYGQHGARLNFIFAMFTLAIVLIARISMEKGIEYASLFAIPLAIVTALAVARFAQIQGPLAAYSHLINGGLMAVIWWSAHKLTWDCTFIDDQQDASGEGLLQAVGLDSDTVERQVHAVQPKGAQSPGSAGGEQNTAAAQQSGSDWFQRMVQRRRRPHTPGIWVLYYALAALPLFGVGQWLIPASDTASREHAFRLICVYVACALGLLLTTSFLGLRRYLRQRNLQMPVDMAGLWLGLGGVMIVAVLLVCVFLPRPGATLSISQLPFGFGSPNHRRTSPYAFGNDGPERPEQATRTSPQAQQQPSDSSAATGQKSESATGNDSAKQPSSKSSSDSSRSDQSQSPHSGSTDEKSSQPSDAQSSQSDNASSSDQQSKNQSGSSSNKDGQQAGKSPPDTSHSRQDAAGAKQPMQQDTAKSGGSAKSQQQQQQSAQRDQQKTSTAKPNPRSDQSSGDGQQPRASQQPGDREATNAENTATGSGTKPEQEPANGPRFDRDQEPSAADRTPQQADQRDTPQQSASPPRARPPWNPARMLSTITSGIGNLLKLLFFAALVCVAVFFAWKYREQVRQALAQLWRDLRQLWASLWGRRAAIDAETSVPADQPAGPPVPSFASYKDPFATGTAERYTTEQLVCYSFEALEAWGREHGCARSEDQTPLEYAQQLAGHHAAIGPETHMLADLYCRLAYGREKIASQRRDNLRRLWQHLRQGV